ncbi:hypothetical protein B0H16DRAFT_366423 [Mycena metata]|uniref:Uncharacterized protein n=1 Tax=Mycena metata TaxID=1033252 RepID=A0AAD7HIF1_9AGAR|nr:hypothetical protein B0H16DRAFT_366423 [Mycena metata]
MCRWRHVRKLYLRCGHAENSLPTEVCLDSPPRPTQFTDLLKAKCSNAKCKFSLSHPADCVPPLCRTTCFQYHGFPEQYAPNVDGFCTACRNGRK